MMSTRSWIPGLMLVIGWNAVEAMTQKATVEPIGQPVATGVSAVIAVDYNVSDADGTLTGLGLRLHWDSTQLTLLGLTNVFSVDRVGVDATCHDDSSSDYDNDSSTDCYALVGWASLAGNWPGGLPQNLLQAQFSNLLSDAESTRINLSASSTSAGWVFSGSPAIFFNGASDNDDDGITDPYEISNGLNPLINDASADLDGDKFSNLEEFQMGTASNDPYDFPGGSEGRAAWGIISVLPFLLDH